MERQFTATAYILNEDKVLLIYHRKLQKWLPPGGHMDSGETPPETARREAYEETGLQIQFLTQENVWLERWNAKSFERPYMCLLEEIPAYQDKAAHQHVDFIYIARPYGGQEKLNSLETGGLRWFTLDEIDAMQGDIEIFIETQQALRAIFNTSFSAINKYS